MALMISEDSSTHPLGLAETDMVTTAKTTKDSKAKGSAESYIDGAFKVEKKRWGTWSSYDKDGNPLVTSLSEELCIAATRFYLKGKQEGFSESDNSYEGFVGGKL